MTRMNLNQVIEHTERLIEWQEAVIHNRSRPRNLTASMYREEYAVTERAFKRMLSLKPSQHKKYADRLHKLRALILLCDDYNDDIEKIIAKPRDLDIIEVKRSTKPRAWKKTRAYNELDDTDDMDARYRRELRQYGVPY